MQLTYHYPETSKVVYLNEKDLPDTLVWEKDTVYEITKEDGSFYMLGDGVIEVDLEQEDEKAHGRSHNIVCIGMISILLWIVASSLFK